MSTAKIFHLFSGQNWAARRRRPPLFFSFGFNVLVGVNNWAKLAKYQLWLRVSTAQCFPFLDFGWLLLFLSGIIMVSVIKQSERHC
jgi:hypothetical protein